MIEIRIFDLIRMSVFSTTSPARPKPKITRPLPARPTLDVRSRGKQTLEFQEIKDFFGSSFLAWLASL